MTLVALLFNLIQINDLRSLHQQDTIVVKLHLSEVVVGDFLLLDVLYFVWVDGEHRALSEEGVHQIARAIVKTVYREIHRGALYSELLRLQLEAFLDDVVGEVPNLLALVIEAERENARLINEDDVDKRVRYIVYRYDALLEADHLRNVQLLQHVRLVEHSDLEYFIFYVRNGI